MSHSTQLDFHPNADSLNDFVEHALPEPERQEILAHLAGCNRCRQVIYLARETPSVVETPVPTFVATPQFTIPRDSWFANWRPAWVSVAACTAIIAVAVFLYVGHRVPAPEVAKVVPSASGGIPNPSSPEHTPVEAPHSQLQPAPTNSVAASSIPTPSSMPSEELPHLTERSNASQDTGLDGPPPTGQRVRPTTPSGALGSVDRTAQGQGEADVAGMAPPSTEAEVTLGQTPAEVIADNGLPKTIENLDNKSIYVYPDKRITFVDGKSSEMDPVVMGNETTASHHGLNGGRRYAGSRVPSGNESPVVVAAWQTAPAKIALGETPDEVIAINGWPRVIATVPNKSIYLYPDVKITFVDGRASEIEAASAIASQQLQPVAGTTAPEGSAVDSSYRHPGGANGATSHPHGTTAGAPAKPKPAPQVKSRPQ